MRTGVGRRYGGQVRPVLSVEGVQVTGSVLDVLRWPCPESVSPWSLGSSAVVAQGNHECRKVGEGMCPVTRCSQTLSSPAAETKKKKKEKERR